MGIVLSHISVARGGRPILQDINLTAQGGSVTGIIGPNGAGKSTLLAMMMGLIPAHQGRFLVDGRDISGQSSAERAACMGWLPQKTQFAWPMAVRDVVALGRLSGALGASWDAREQIEEAVAMSLQALDISHLASRAVTELSGGEQALVALARLFVPDFMTGPRACLLVDEPLQSLDPKHQLQVLACLRAQAEQGVAVIIVFHDLNLATQYCDQLVVIDHGRVADQGAPLDIIEKGCLENIFGVDLASFIPKQNLQTHAYKGDTTTASSSASSSVAAS